MKILLSNDDGVNALGLHVLYRALSQIADVTVVAPDRNCSAASNSLTLLNPLRVIQLESGFYAVNGTPTDAVHVGINQIMETPPDIVIAGINHGANLGDDVVYSGTVAAATEGRHMGLPAIAVSLCSHTEEHFETAAQVTVNVVEHLIKQPLSNDEILNVNVPNIALSEIKGINITRLGSRHKAQPMTKEQDPWGRDIYWYGKLGAELDEAPDTDFYAIKNQYVSLTPISIDMTAHKSINKMTAWISEITL